MNQARSSLLEEPGPKPRDDAFPRELRDHGLGKGERPHETGAKGIEFGVSSNNQRVDEGEAAQ